MKEIFNETMAEIDKPSYQPLIQCDACATLTRHRIKVLYYEGTDQVRDIYACARCGKERIYG